MNKFLLTFENKYLEQSYQDDRQSIITTPIMKLVLFFSLGYCIVDVSLAIVNKDYFQITIKLLLMGMIIVDIIVLIFKQAWIRVALMISNIIVMVHQLDMNYECDKNRAYIYGSNLMIINLLLINESDFRCAVIQILALYIIRIGIAFSQKQLPVQPHIFTILLSVIVIYNCYQKESQNRRKYLLHVKDIQYGKLILKLLKEPFFISTFDKEKLKLKTILTNTVGGTYEHFLCKAKVDNQSITNYIYKNMKQELNNDDFVQQYFIAYYFDKKYEIQLSEYFLDQPVFQIVVQTVNERESKLIQSFNKQYDRYLEFLKMITTMIQKYKRRRQHSQLQKLQYTMIEYYSYQRTKYRELQIKEIDLYIFLRNTFRQFYMNNLNNRHPYQIQRNANVVIQSDKQILNIFSCLILRNVIQLDTLKLTNIRNCIQVTILGDYNSKIEKDKSLQYLYKQGLISDYFFGAQTQIYMITKRLGHY